MSMYRATAAATLIEELLDYPLLGSSTRRFLLSLKSWSMQRPLTHRQIQSIECIKASCQNRPQPSIEWKAAWNKEKKEKAVICASYYIKNPPYFDNLARRVIMDKGFIPTEEEYNKLTRNKYAGKVLNAYYSAGKYHIGELVTFRAHVPMDIESLFLGRPATIIKINLLPITSAAKGAKKYMALPLGSDKSFVIEERYIKKYK